MLPPPAVGSRTVYPSGALPNDDFSQSRSSALEPVAEGSVVTVGILHTDSCPPCALDCPTCRNRVSTNPQHVQEPLAIGVGGKQRGEHGSSRGYERSARPPHVQVVDWRQCRHRPTFSDALFSERRNRQPAFDEAGVRHRFPQTRQFASPPSFSWSSRRPQPTYTAAASAPFASATSIGWYCGKSPMGLTPGGSRPLKSTSSRWLSGACRFTRATATSASRFVNLPLC